MTPRTLPLDFYLNRSYPFRVEADADGGFVIIFPDLPGCISQADSPEEIGQMAEEARRLWIETEYEAGEQIPEPSRSPSYSGKFNLRLPKSLHGRLVESAEREGVSLNQYVLALLSDAQARTETASSRKSSDRMYQRA